MRNLDQVVHLGVGSYYGVGQLGAVHAAVGLDFHIVFNNYIADLRDFVVPPFVEDKAKAVIADFGPRLQNDVVFKDAVLAHDHLRIQNALRADLGALADVYLGEEDGVVANDYIVLNHAVSAYGHVFPQLGRRADDGGRVNARGVFGLLRIPILHQQGKRPFRVFGIQEIGFNG